MYAIVEIAGQQYKVAKDQKVFVHRLEGKEGAKVSFDKVLLMDDGKVTIGAPVIENAVVSAKILGHLKGDKVIVFKKKRRKGYKVKNGHRQFLTEIQIDGISVKAPAKKTVAKKEAEADKKPAAKKETAKKEAAPAKEAAAKKAPAKKAAPAKKPKAEATAKAAKPAAKKTAAKKPAAKKENPEK